jgi:hypothetical protein
MAAAGVPSFAPKPGGSLKRKRHITRETAPPETVFTLTIDAQEIRVRYRPNHIGGRDAYAILEFISPHQPRRRTPVSESGYRSFFAPMRDIEAASSIEIYAGMVAVVLSAECRATPNRRAP